MNNNVENKKKTKPNIIVIIFMILGIILLILGTVWSLFGTPASVKSLNKGKCVDEFQPGLTMTRNSTTAVEMGDTQYMFDSSYDIELIKKINDFDNLGLKVCYTSASNPDFFVGGTSKTKNVTSIEVYHKTTNEKINATTFADLLTDQGYYTYGDYEEEATVLEITGPEELYSSDLGKYTIYLVELELSNEKEVEAEYKILTDMVDKSSLLEKNKKYKFNFTVEEHSYKPVGYTIKDFN